jgi:hypothetical protein
LMGMIIIVSPIGQSALSLASELQSEQSWERAQDIAFSGGSGITVLASVPGTYRWVAQLPFVLFAPFPWEWLTIGSGASRLVGFEMAVTYLMMYLLARRFKKAKSAGARSLLIFAFSLALATSFSLPNLGSIHRYRTPAVVLFLAAYACCSHHSRRYDPTRRLSGSHTSP